MSNEIEAADLNADRLMSWLSETLGTTSESLHVEKFKAGQSNPTYKVRFRGQDYVLRRKPFGDLLPSAHAVDREFRILEALKPKGFAVPAPIALCQDEDIIGVDFYLMEFVDGRVFHHAHMPDAAPQERRAAYLGLANTLAELHRIDFDAAGLGDFARPGNYYERQVRRWSKQYRATRTEENADIEHLLECLPDQIPAQTGTCIVHGDYSLRNVVLDHDSARVAAVLDWELTTIGDPLADFSYMTMLWAMPLADPFAMGHVDLEAVGIPNLQQMQEAYATAAGLSDLPPMNWHFAFNLFRLVCIFQGIKKRMLGGNAASSKAAAIVSLIPALAERARALAAAPSESLETVLRG